MKDFFKTIAAWIRITLKPSTTGPMLEMVDRVAAEFGLSKQVYHPDPLHWADGSVIYYVCSTELGQVDLCSIDTSKTRMKIVFNFVDKAEQSGDDLIVNGRYDDIPVDRLTEASLSRRITAGLISVQRAVHDTVERDIASARDVLASLNKETTHE